MEQSVTRVASPLLQCVEGIRVGDGGTHGIVSRTENDGRHGGHDLAC
jgi:hypothetical protein